MLEWIATQVTERRGLTFVLIALALAAAVGTTVVRGVPVDFSPQALFRTFEVQQDIDDRFVQHFGSTDNVAFVVVRGPDVTDLPTLQYIHSLAQVLGQQPYADRVEAITESAIPRSGGPGELLVDSPIRGDQVEAAHAEALRDALAGSTLFDGVLISDDRDTAVVAVFLARGMESLSALQPIIADMQAQLVSLPPPTGATAEVGGLPYTRVYMVECFVRDQTVLIPAACIVCMLLLFLTFRWIPAVVFPAVTVGFTGVFVVGGMALVQEPFNIINQVVPTLIIVIGISDSIHLISRYQEELRVHGERKQAARRTLVAMASACFLTSFTTAVGFGSLLVSKTSILARFGVTAAMAVMIAYVVTVLFLPPALTLVKARVSTFKHTTEGAADGIVERFTVRAVGVSLRHPWKVLVGSVLVCSAFAVLASGVRVDTSLMESFPEQDPIYLQTQMLETELNGVLPLEVSLSASAAGRFDDPEVLNALAEVQVWLRAQPQVLSTRSYGDVLHEAWAAYADDASKRDEPFRNRAQVAQLASLLEGGRPDPIAPYVTSDRRHLRLNAQLRDDGSIATLALAAALTEQLESALDGVEDLTIELTGDAYSGSLGLDSLIRDMAASLSLAFLIIFGIMAVLFRSVRIGLISVPANVIPLLMTAAYMGLQDIPLNASTVIIFSVSIGIAVDDTIHMLARYREERAVGHSIDDALLAAARGSGRAIVVTSIMLGAGMLVMLASSFMPVRLFGELISVTLVACLFGDLLLLPAMLKLFAKR